MKEMKFTLETTAPTKSEQNSIGTILTEIINQQNQNPNTQQKIIPLTSPQTAKLERLQTLYSQVHKAYEKFVIEQSISTESAKFGEMTENDRFNKFLNSKNIKREDYEKLISEITAEQNRLAEIEKIAKRGELTKNPYKHFRQNRNLKLEEPEQIEDWRNRFNVTDEEFAQFEQERTAAMTEQAAQKKLEEQQKFQERVQKIGNIIKSARIPKIFSEMRLENFRITGNNKNAIECLKAITNNQGFYIYGDCGTGKTLLVSIIANERAERFKNSTFICATDIFKELNVFNNENQAAVMNKFHLIRTTPCLIIDDLGVENATPFTQRTLFDILNYRYNENLQTIITSNFTLEKLQSRMGDYEGRRIIRRIKAICREIELTEA